MFDYINALRANFISIDKQCVSMENVKYGTHILVFTLEISSNSKLPNRSILRLMPLSDISAICSSVSLND